MPKYELSQEELSSLADFILSLDFDRCGSRVIHHPEKITQKNR